MTAGRFSGYKGLVSGSPESCKSLCGTAVAGTEAGGSYNQTDAKGFLRIQGLPIRVQGRVTPQEY